MFLKYRGPALIVIGFLWGTAVAYKLLYYACLTVVRESMNQTINEMVMARGMAVGMIACPLGASFGMLLIAWGISMGGKK